MLFWFLAKKISLGCFRLEAGAGSWRGRERGAEHGCVGTEMPPQTPRAAGAEPWLVAALPARDRPESAPLPPPVLAAPSANWGGCGGSLPAQTPGKASSKGCPVFGMFSSLLLGNSPTHPHEHQKDIHWFIELFVCSRLPFSAVPCRRWACQALAGAPGRFLTITPVAAFVLLSKGAAKPKLAAGKV